MKSNAFMPASKKATADETTKTFVKMIHSEADSTRIKAELLRLEEQAKATGYQEGLEKARLEVEAQTKKAIEEEKLKATRDILSMVTNMRQAFASVTEDTSAQLKQILLVLSKAYASEFLCQNPDKMVEHFNELLKPYQDAQNDISATVNPEDAELIKEQIEKDPSLKEVFGQINWLTDEVLIRGSINIKSGDTETIASLNARAKTLAKDLWAGE